MNDDQNSDSQQWDEDVGTSQDAQANLEGDSEPNTETDTGEDGQSPNPSLSGKTPEELRQERIEAIRQAQRNKASEREARADAEFFKTALSVGKDPKTLKGVYRKNPDLAERVAQEVWGVPYDSVITSTDDGQGHLDQESVRSLLREELRRTQEVQESQAIEETIVDFTLEYDLNPLSATCKRIMDKYALGSPKNAKQARELLDMAYIAVTGNVKKTVQNEKNIVSASVPTNKGGIAKVSKEVRSVTPHMREYMEQRHGKEYVQKYLKGQI